jgi:hypothetical protein
MELKRFLFSANIELEKRSESDFPSFSILKLDSTNFTLTPPSSLNRFTLIHLTNGHGRFKLAMEDYILKENSIYFGCPGQIISHLELENVNGYLLHSEADFMLKTNPTLLDYSIFRLFGKRHEFNLNSENNERLLDLAREMLKEFEGKKYKNEEMLKTLVLQHVILTDRIMYEGNSVQGKELHPKVRAFFAMLNLMRIVNVPVTEYAEALNISPNYLNQLVRKLRRLPIILTIIILNILILISKSQ